jgi:RecA-family ATPase
MALQPIDYNQVKATLQLLHNDSKCFEIRILEGTSQNKESRIYTGFFDSPDNAVEGLKKWADSGMIFAKGIYVTLNPVNPIKLAGKFLNKMAVAGTDESTADTNITKRNWLLVDCDVERKPSNSSATNEEKEASLRKAKLIREALTGLGWPVPYFADSGNGYHLLYPIDLPRDDSGLVEGVLKGLQKKFELQEPTVKVDVSVFNPARISKLYGTFACKGADTSKTPHRLSQLIVDEFPKENPATVSEQLLKARVLVTPPADSKKDPYTGPPSSFNLHEWAKKYQVALSPARNSGPDGSTAYNVECPFNKEHGVTKEVQVYLWEEGPEIGKTGFKCQHDSCANNHWQKYRAKIEGLNATKAPPVDPTNTKDPFTDEATGLPIIKSIEEWCQEKDEPIEWLVDELISYGSLNIFAGNPKAGKSTLARTLCQAVMSGGYFLGRKCTQGKVMYLCAEGSPRHEKEHYKKMCNKQNGFFEYYTLQPKQLIPFLEMNFVKHGKAALIILDTISYFLGVENQNDIAQVIPVLKEWQNFAVKNNVSFCLLAWVKKGNAVGGSKAGGMGSQAFRGNAGLNLTLESKEDEEGSVTYVTMDKTEQRDGKRIDRSRLVMDQNTEEVTIFGSVSKLSEASYERDIRNHFQTFRQKQTIAEVMTAISQTNRSRVKKALDRMAKTGELRPSFSDEKAKNGKASKLFEYVGPIASNPSVLFPMLDLVDLKNPPKPSSTEDIKKRYGNPDDIIFDPKVK